MSTVNSMSRMYDNLEPTVIDEDLLRSAVEEQGPKEEAGKIAKAEGIDFGDVTALRLDFKNVLTIDNLWEFTALTKLQLDNNIIEKVEGLDSLVNLIWLDLSFNNIEVIEGLDQLTKLEDLTLYSNRISKIENMDNLENLQVLSVGNNILKDLENVIYLRRFRKLKTLTLKGNPFCEENTYKQYVIAFLSNIEFLDYKLIHPQAREAAIEKYMIPREEMLHNERQANAIIEEENKRKVEVELHKIAYVENMDGDSLFESLYAEDTEGKKLAEFPAINELIDSFREKFVGICYQIFEYGIKEHDKRQAEVNQFWECIEEAKNENKQLGIKAIDEFMLMKKRVLQELTQISDQRVLEQQISDYNKVISELWDKLMGYELQLVDQLEEVVKDFERNLQDMVSMFIESIMAFMSQARDLENTHHEKLSEIALPTVDKLAKNELDDEISEDVRMLFVDKDTIINAISTSHDYHLLKIDNKEEDMTTRINNWMKGLLEKIYEEEEIQRNRLRVVEINHLVDHLRDEIDNLEVGQAGGY